MTFFCDLCVFSTSDKSNFNKHLKTTKHRKASGEHVPPSEGKVYGCEPCGFSTKNKKNFSLHLLTQKHKILEESAKPETENFCSVCSFQAKTPGGFSRHLETNKHRQSSEESTCVSLEKALALARKISYSPRDEEIVLYFETKNQTRGKTSTNARISYAIDTTLVTNEITLFEASARVLAFLGVKIDENKGGTFLAKWKRKKYDISRKNFLAFVLNTVAIFDDRCKDIINGIYRKFCKSRWCAEPLKDILFEHEGDFLRFRNARNNSTGDSIVVAASVDGLLRFSGELFGVFERLRKGKKTKRLTEGFCIWWSKGRKFKEEVEKCNRGCVFTEEKAPCFEHSTEKETETDSEETEPDYRVLRSVSENQYLSFLGNFRMSAPGGICADAKAIVFIEKTMSRIIKESPLDASPFDTRTSFYVAILEKKEAAKRNITLSFFGFEPRSSFSCSVIEKIMKLQE